MEFFKTVIFPPLFRIISGAIWLYEIVLLIRIVLSWVNPDPYNRLVIIIRSVTDPYLDFFRRIIPLRIGMLDLSPVFAFLALEILQRALAYLARLLFV
jgi:YggT family protein